MKEFIKDIYRAASGVDDMLLDLFGVDGKRLFINQAETAKYLRLPADPQKREAVFSWIKSVDPTAEMEKDIPLACKVNSELPWSRHIRYYLGDIHSQTLASMLPPLVLDPQLHETVLDMAAAPGSKTSELADLMRNTGRLVANDSNRQRLAALTSNLDRLGIINTAICNLRGEQIGNRLPGFFDRILVDAPCSSIGEPQKWCDVENWLKPKNIKKLAETQAKLLHSASKAAKPGATIVYSTCTLNPLENEAVVDWALRHLPLELEAITHSFGLKRSPIKYAWQGLTFDKRLNGAFKISPLDNPTEGFFIARFKKTGDEADLNIELKRFVPAGKKTLKPFWDHYGMSREMNPDYAFTENNGKIWMLSNAWEEGMLPFSLKTGLKIAQTRKQGEWRFTPAGSQLLGHRVKQRKHLINEDSWSRLMNTGKIKMDGEEGYYLLYWGDRPVTYGLLENGRLRIKIGRPFLIAFE